MCSVPGKRPSAVTPAKKSAIARSYRAVWAKASPAKLPPQFQRRAAVGRDLLENLGILPGVGGDRREGVVLGRRPDHRRPADVDLLDRLVERHVRLADGGFERIEIHHDQFEGEDAVLGQRLHVLGVVVPAEDAAVDLRMERLEPPVHHFREAGVVGHVADTRCLSASKCFRVPPVLKISTPAATSPRAKPASPCLSLTLIKAR